MAPAINQALVAMGFCHHFPRSMVFGPAKLGLGITHIHTQQEILRLQDITFHTSKNTFTGHLYRVSLEHLILEVGVGDKILDHPYNRFHILATNSLIKFTWKFLSDNELSLCYDITLPSFRLGDTPILAFFLSTNAPAEDLAKLNLC